VRACDLRLTRLEAGERLVADAVRLRPGRAQDLLRLLLGGGDAVGARAFGFGDPIGGPRLRLRPQFARREFRRLDDAGYPG
jgi:hypothetical protein